ncbi:hypothetical protein Mal15_10940 [Stieleria maiorica]|uniref:Uncharacterized protein n=1 Tax=Stieleria maiorica TaxID=2795974 RepID=A0A5B9M8V1_9BACT|nr:hypothetical protein [Stieleria maiorica]QEF97059.1 hypothetical protein Mal15_10940 [Stieleria maiorica]
MHDESDDRPVGDGCRSPLEQHLDRLDVLKVGLWNSFGIDLRTATRRVQEDDGQTRSERFHYLPELIPFLHARVITLETKQRRAYESVKERATESFWKLYSDFQPMVHVVAESTGIDADRLDPVLGRSLLLFDASRRTKFVTYLEKSLRESVKNLRGEDHARQLGLPLSAGRLVPQMQWVLQRAAMEAGRQLSAEESDAVVIEFLTQHRCKFSNDSMRRIAEVMRRGRGDVSLQSCREWLEPSVNPASGVSAAGNDGWLEAQEEHDAQLRQVHAAIDRAGFDADEQCIVLHRLGLPHDQTRYDRVASAVTSASLRKRAARLLVRLMAARYAPQAPRFGGLLHSTSSQAKDALHGTLAALATENGMEPEVLATDLLNWMSLSESVYRVSIAQRGRVAEYLCGDSIATLPSGTFQKLKAALIEQERLGFPCWDESASTRQQNRFF